MTPVWLLQVRLTSRRLPSGGLVEPNSWTRDADGLVHRFRITDCLASVTVEYRGLLPDLFIEGQVRSQGENRPGNGRHDR